MPAIELRFPAGRFHATPWGRHVNEGAVEWPPSPWRILRALIATWHLKATAEVPEALARELIHALAESPPAYELPPASLGHTRHFMPVIEGSNEKKTKVFDTFIHVGAPLHARWNVSLSAEQKCALAILCERMNYLGRAESLVEASVLVDDGNFQENVYPLTENEAVPNGRELVRLLAPQSEPAFQEWRGSVAAAESAPKAKRKKAVRNKAAPVLPANVFEALHADTGELQAAGWTLPPGSRLVDYTRGEDCFALAPVHSQPRLTRPTVARFAVDSAVLPRITRAVSVAERVHQALVARFVDGAARAVFTGLSAEGKPLQGHQHAFIFCEANGRRDAITHVTVFARDGFDARARRALESLQRVWGHGGHDLQLVLLGFGDADTFSNCALLGTSKVWRSLTPFLATRHPKTFRDGRPKLDTGGWAIGSPEHDLRRLIRETRDAAGRPLPFPAKVETLPRLEVNTRWLSPLEFQTERHHGGGTRARQAARAFKVTFPEPVSGPLAFGYGAHFGLGLFVPAAGHVL